MPQPAATLRIALSAGEPAGIGPELIAHAIARGAGGAQLVYIGDSALLEQACRVIRKPCALVRFEPSYTGPMPPATVYYVPQKLNAASEFGFLRQSNAAYVLNVLSRAAAGCLSNEFDALVTGPVHKGVINDAGIAFSGHTEFLQQLSGGAPVVMLLATSALRVALATTHLPLRQVSAAVTKSLLVEVIRTLELGLRDQFGIAAPCIGVLGLNPHAGEGGHLGSEELDIIEPVLTDLRARGLKLLGPWPADTAFVPERLKQVDAILAMYHDQGLPVLKAQGFGEAVNITLGLPFVRTSVDHGTALELAGKALARPESLYAAIDCALKLAAVKRQAGIKANV
jgi:4-hydroxythreonine-4-phosphate dehydrogenase